MAGVELRVLVRNSLSQLWSLSDLDLGTKLYKVIWTI
jgi:hypothetical protein